MTHILRLISATTGAPDRGVIYTWLTDLGVSDKTAQTVQGDATTPIVVVIILIVALVLTRLERRLSRRLVHSLRVASPLVRTSDRAMERGETLAGVLSAVIRAVIWITAVLSVFSQFNIRLTPFVASATVIGAALGFGAQTLVKDFLSGILILAEDQYGVGDTLEIGSLVATVEGVTLRVTRLRALDGVVWYVPNGDIRTVGNHSDGTSQAVVDLVVPTGTDLYRAGELAEAEARALAEDPLWKHEMLSPPAFVGVQDATSTTVTLRLLAQTPAGHHFRVARELRLRILTRWVSERVAWAPTPEADA
jgi:small-conductance mechanosensitive channel